MAGWEKLVYDFTEEKDRREIDIRDLGSTKKYIELKKSKRTEYSVEEKKNKVIVSFITDKYDEYDCIYYKKETKDIEELIKKNEDINLAGCYIKDFDITKFENYKDYELRNFDASFSFWDGDFDISGVRFEKGDVSFKNANFGDGDVKFKCVEFGEGDLRFEDAQFGIGDVKFESVQFGDGGIIFDNVQFGAGEVIFDDVKFGAGDVSFSEAEVDKIIFYESNFLAYENLKFQSVNSLEIAECILEKYLMISGINEKSALSFRNTANIGQIYFNDESENIVISLNRFIRKVFRMSIRELFHKFYKDESWKIKIVEFYYDWKEYIEIAQKGITMIKENYHALGDYDGEDSAYRLYMKYKTNSWYKWPLKFFSLVGGYGTKPLRIIITMLVAWFGFAGAYLTFFIKQFEEPLSTFWDTLYYSGITFLTIGYGDISPAVEKSIGLRFVSVAEGFIGLFLMSYLTVAVVRKLLR